MATVNMSSNNVKVGNDGISNDHISSSPVGDSNSDCLTQIYITRGDIDLNEGRLPTLGDATIRPTDPLVRNTAFIVSAAGTAINGILGTTALNVGDYLVLSVNGDPTVASNWIGVVNSVISKAQMPSTNYWGTNNKWVKIISESLDFFP
jgi:hypothetical protein